MDALFFTSLGISLLYLAVSVLAGIGFFTERRAASGASNVLAITAAIAHLGFLTYIGVNEQKIPFTSFFEAMSVKSLFLVLIYLILLFALKLNTIGFFAFPLHGLLVPKNLSAHFVWPIEHGETPDPIPSVCRDIPTGSLAEEGGQRDVSAWAGKTV